MSPLARILAAHNRSLNTGFLAFVLVASIIITLTLVAAETVAPVTV